MENLKKLFPIKATAGDVKSLIIAIVVYVVAGAVVTAVLGTLLGWIPLVGIIVNIVCTLIDIYCLGGIIVAILTYCNSI